MNLLKTVGGNLDQASLSKVKASSYISQGFGESLPPDQWITELRSWESQVWAAHQIALAEYATGPKAADPTADSYTIQPSSAAERALCESLKARKSGGFVNINVFALAFTLTLSLTFTFLDLVILRFFIYLSRFKKALSPRIERWIQDDIFQLQRRAYEATGEGVWTKLEKEIPITRQATMLSDFVSEPTPPGVLKERVNTSSDSSTSSYDSTEKDYSGVTVG